MRNRWPKLVLAALLATAPFVTAAAAPPPASPSTVAISDPVSIRSRCPCSSLSSPDLDAQVRTRCTPICLAGGDETIGTLP